MALTVTYAGDITGPTGASGTLKDYRADVLSVTLGAGADYSGGIAVSALLTAASMTAIIGAVILSVKNGTTNVLGHSFYDTVASKVRWIQPTDATTTTQIDYTPTTADVFLIFVIGA